MCLCYREGEKEVSCSAMQAWKTLLTHVLSLNMGQGVRGGDQLHAEHVQQERYVGHPCMDQTLTPFWPHTHTHTRHTAHRTHRHLASSDWLWAWGLLATYCTDNHKRKSSFTMKREKETCVLTCICRAESARSHSYTDSTQPESADMSQRGGRGGC